MFLGTYEHTLDDKSRLTISLKLRNKMPTTGVLYLSGGIDECLQLRTEAEFKEFIDKLTKKSALDSKTRLIKRHILGNTVEVELDSSNRINIPANILKLAKIKKQVYLIGQGDYIEIWDHKKYDNYIEENKNNLISFANTLGED